MRINYEMLDANGKPCVILCSAATDAEALFRKAVARTHGPSELMRSLLSTRHPLMGDGHHKGGEVFWIDSQARDCEKVLRVIWTGDPSNSLEPIVLEYYPWQLGAIKSLAAIDQPLAGVPGFDTPKGRVVLLTNAICENAFVSDDVLRRMGLPMREDGFYPLTDEESLYVEAEYLDSPGCPCLATTSLFQGRKWLSPTLSFPVIFPEEPDVALPAEQAMLRAAGALAEIAPRAARHGGHAFIFEGNNESGELDHYEVRVLLPFELARANARNFEEWMDWLGTEMFPPARSAAGVLREVAKERGWDESAQLFELCDFIDSQHLDGALRNHLRQVEEAPGSAQLLG